MALACAVVFLSDAFQQCINESYYGSPSHEPEKGIAFVFGLLGIGRACTGSFLEGNGEALTAFFTLILSGSTIGLWLSTKHLWTVTKEVVDLANKEFIATHRPKIVVYGFKTIGSTTRDDDEPIQFRYANIGDVDAFVTEIGTTLVESKRPDFPPPDVTDFDRHVMNPPLKIISGHQGFKLTKDTVSQLALVMGSSMGAIFCIGYLAYKDSLGRRGKPVFVGAMISTARDG